MRLRELDPKTREDIRQRLEDRLDELAVILSAHEKESSSLLPMDAEEAAPIVREMNVIESEEAGESREMRLIREALERLDGGTYGRCVDCGEAIPAERLWAVPAAASCMACQRKKESLKRGR